MPWKQQGGGGGGGGGPWGSGGGGDGRSGGRGGGGGQAPDFEEMLRKSQDRVKRFIPGGFGSGRGILFAVLGFVVLWLVFGGIFYRVQPDEQGVVLRFGKWVDTTPPGLHFKLPAPISTVMTPKVTRVNRILVGVQGSDERGRTNSGRDIPEESLMLTGDENIVDIDFTVFWKIKDAGKFLFNIRDPEQTVKLVAESAMREVIGQTKIQSALTEGRNQIETATHERVQKLIDEYGAGIQIDGVKLLKVDPPQPVIDAFIDVQRARADEERIRNEAQAYANDILPRARGEAEKMIQAANAYKEQIVNKAQGEAKRYLEIYESYEIAKDITKQRVYIETIEEVFSGMNKIIIDSSAGGSGVVPYLPLPEIQNRSKPSAPATGGGQ